MRCMLFGHRFDRFAGVGDHAGSSYLVCIDCGRTEQVEESEARTDQTDMSGGFEWRRAVGKLAMEGKI